MLLSADVFDGVIARLGCPPAGGAGGNRRQPRVGLDTRLTIVPCPEGPGGPIGPPLTVPVRDLSRGGVRFLLPRRLPLDTQFVAFLPGPAAQDGLDPRPLAVLTAVAYWQPLAKNLFALGGEFVEMLAAFALPVAEPRIVLPGVTAGKTTASSRRAVG